MRKGFLLTLLMVAVVAMAFPVHAKAPIIKDIPDIIIGDNSDITGSGTTATRLFRYLNAMNLLDANVIEWRNGYGLDLHHVFVAQLNAAEPTIQASNTSAFVTSLNSSQYTALTGTAGTAVVSGTEIIDAATTFGWLSLMNTDLVGTLPANAYAPTAGQGGVTTEQLAAQAADLGYTDMVLIAAEIALPTTSPTLIASSPFTVVTMDGSDDMTSGGAETVMDFSFDGGSAENWALTTNFGDSQFGVAVSATDTTNGAIGWNATGAGGGTLSANYGTWYLSDDGTSAKFLIPGAGMEDKVYRVRATLISDATSRAECCSWRLLAASFQNVAWQGMQSLSMGSGDEIDCPYASNNLEAQIHWAVPYDLNEWGDTGALATFAWATTIGGNAPTDARNYNLMFDGVDFGDSGNLYMSTCVVESYNRPADKTTHDYVWGGTGTALNDATNGFGLSTECTFTGVSLGTGSSITASAATLAMGTISSGANWQQAARAVATATATYAETAGDLVRYQIACTSTNPDICPTVRYQTKAFNGTTADNAIWYDAFGPFATRDYLTAAATQAPGTPKTTGSTVDVYRYVMNTSGTRNLEFYWDAYGMTVGTAATTNGWAAQTGSLTVTSIILDGGLTNPGY